MKLFEFVLSHAAEKDYLIEDLSMLFTDIVAAFEETGVDELEWLDLRIIVATYNHFGDILIPASDVMVRLIFFFDLTANNVNIVLLQKKGLDCMYLCKDSESEHIKQVLNGITVKKDAEEDKQ